MTTDVKFFTLKDVLENHPEELELAKVNRKWREAEEARREFLKGQGAGLRNRYFGELDRSGVE